jgi:hypothetical protein
MTDTPEDWVLIEAANRGGHSWKDQSVRQLRDAYADVDVPVFNALCDMIAKHEQPPVDRKLLCAREASAQLDDDVESDYWRSGDGDDCLTCCLRSLALYEEGFGK